MIPTTRTSKSAKRCLRMNRGLTGAVLTGLLIASVNLVGTAIAHAETALIAVAANFADPAKRLAEDFGVQTGHSLKISTGSTGQLYAQITNGAPFDVFLSADAARPEKLEQVGFAVAGSRLTYALGKLVLWRPGTTPINERAEAILSDPQFRFLAIANPDLAPYGAAARETLQARGLWDSLKGRLVFGQNIGQTHALVATGNAEIGFVALAQIKDSNATESYWLVPEKDHQPISQDAVLLTRARDNAAARAFMDYLKSPRARQIIAGFGYEDGSG